ncbi:MAG: hypothetical protein LJU34_07920 [Oscillospiraceae bacterium]|nr:hypothetical protein [Oscillospiraceae bacterium]
MKAWFTNHECIYRALRTFLQTAAGVLAASLADTDTALAPVIAVAVATGLAAVMNMGGQ